MTAANAPSVPCWFGLIWMVSPRVRPFASAKAVTRSIFSEGSMEQVE